jgi:DNA-binding NarL/FixJ family response regulator
MRVILAEDSTLLREGLLSLLERAGHHVVATALDAPGLVQAVDAAARADDLPDIVLTDVRMPPDGLDDGLRAAIALRQQYPGLPVLVLSQYIAGAYARDLLRDQAGGVGYLLKDRVGRVSDFLRSLETVSAGGVVIDSDVIGRLMGATESHPVATLTPREREVLGLMAEGLSNGDIAARLIVSDAAVSKHIGNIFLKLDLVPEDGHRRVRAVLAYLERHA